MIRSQAMLRFFLCARGEVEIACSYVRKPLSAANEQHLKLVWMQPVAILLCVGPSQHPGSKLPAVWSFCWVNP